MTDMDEAVQTRREARDGRKARVSVLIDKEHDGHRPGHHWRRRLSSHTRQMIEYGTRIVAGYARKGGRSSTTNVPIFNTGLRRSERDGREHVEIYVPPTYACDCDDRKPPTPA
jgi:succinyl-CoA synthetase alpha subunit